MLLEATRAHTVGECEPILAWRRWRVVMRRHGGYNLKSIHVRQHLWRNGAASTTPPTLDDALGLHAFKSYRAAIGYGVKPPIVVGQVALWGVVIEHWNGYRAEHARVVRLSKGEYVERAAIALRLPWGPLRPRRRLS